MENRWHAIFAAAVLAFAGIAPAFAAPCDAAEFRAFDFWIGEWRVTGPAGKLAGINRIEREYDGCVLHEHYVTGRGYSGESLNTYDAGPKVWQPPRVAKT